jgi:hypothetical protein
VINNNIRAESESNVSINTATEALTNPNPTKNTVEKNENGENSIKIETQQNADESGAINTENPRVNSGNNATPRSINNNNTRSTILRNNHTHNHNPFSSGSSRRNNNSTQAACKLEKMLINQVNIIYIICLFLYKFFSNTKFYKNLFIYFNYI